MKEELDVLGMLDLMTLPGFCVQQGQIAACNAAARALLFTPGMEISELLQTGQKEYAAFTDGCLYLTLCCCGVSHAASLRRIADRIEEIHKGIGGMSEKYRGPQLFAHDQGKDQPHQDRRKHRAAEDRTVFFWINRKLALLHRRTSLPNSWFIIPRPHEKSNLFFKKALVNGGTV